MLQGQHFQQARLSKDARFDGQFFVAVKTTGIFCRPICPAPAPKEENVEYYQFAAQALNAGFRPCIRCRPDSAPHSWAWKGVDTTVERALNLLQQNPELGLEPLSDKLGISDRYLRKLFQQKLGVSPKQYRLYQQVLFAKQLLQQSELRVEDIAQACGFQSARSLQYNLGKHLKLTPSQLRKKADTRAQTIQLQLFYRPPYHWQQVRDFLARRAIEGVEFIADDRYKRHFSSQHGTGWFEAKIRPEQHCFDVEIHLSHTRDLYQVVNTIRRVLDLDLDVQQVDRALEACGIPAQLKVHGLRIPGIWHPFEAGCRAILGQQISVTAAIKLLNKLVQGIQHSENGLLLFPTPEQLSNSELDFIAMPGKRKQCLRDFAQLMQQHPDTDPQQWLKIKGIGQWTADYAKLRGQSLPDVWLDKDLIIRQQLDKHQIDAEQAKPWRSYLTFQLWSMA